MSRLAEAVGALARHEVARMRTCELGVVTSVFAAAGTDADHACAVQLRDTGLVLPRVAVATGLSGAASPPRVGDLVVVVFVAGDVHAPVVVGRLYTDELPPPEHGPDEHVVRIPAGVAEPSRRVDLVVTAPDAAGRQVRVSVDGDSPVELTVAPGRIEATVGDVRWELRQPGGSPGQAAVRIGGNEVAIDGAGEVSVTADKTLALRASEVVIEGSASVTINGSMVEIN